MNYKQWVNNITPQQVRAFASQVGVGNWRNDTIHNLTAALVKSQDGKQLWSKIFGT